MTEPVPLRRASPTAEALLREVVRDLRLLTSIESQASVHLRGFIACCHASVADAARALSAGDSDAWAMIHRAGYDVQFAMEDARAQGLLAPLPG